MFNALFTKTDEYARLAQALGGPGACALFGIPGSGRAMVYAALAKALDKPLCIVTPGEAEATRFAGDLNALGVAAAVFPARDYVLRPIEGTGREYEYRRLAVLGDLVGGRLQAVCVPDEGLTQYTTPRADFCANTRSLRPGDTLPRAELTALLYGAGYTRRDQVDGPGQFSIRGDIADIYAPDMKQPARMEFWGDEIDTMHTFDLATQRRDEPIEKIYVSPAREILFGQPADAAEKIRSYIKKARGRRRTALETCTAADLAQLDGGAMPVNMDKYLTLRYPEPATILDYFDDPLLILEEPASLREAERATAFRRGEELSALLEDGVLAAGLDKLYAESGWLWAQCAAHRTLCAENFARSMPDVPLKTIVNAPAHTLPAWSGEVAALLEDIQPLCSGGTAVTVPVTERYSNALVRDFQSQGRNCYIKDINFGSDGNPVILYLTSDNYLTGPAGGVRSWQTAHWDGRQWHFRDLTTSTHCYDSGSLWIDDDDVWTVIAPTDAGPQYWGTGGEMVMWRSRDKGQTWKRVRTLTHDSPRNHGYARRPLHADPDFYAFWADGDPDNMSISRLYFCNERGDLFRMPYTMQSEWQKPEPIPGGRPRD